MRFVIISIILVGIIGFSRATPEKLEEAPVAAPVAADIRPSDTLAAADTPGEDDEDDSDEEKDELVDSETLVEDLDAYMQDAKAEAWWTSRRRYVARRRAPWVPINAKRCNIGTKRMRIDCVIYRYRTKKYLQSRRRVPPPTSRGRGAYGYSYGRGGRGGRGK